MDSCVVLAASILTSSISQFPRQDLPTTRSDGREEVKPRDIICGLCNHSFDRFKPGCGACQAAKKHIIWPHEHSVETDSLLETAYETLDLLRRQLRALRDEQDQQFGGGKFYDEKLIRGLGALSRSIAALVNETRKLEKVAAQEAEEMSLEHKARVMATFIQELPMQHRLDFMEFLKGELDELAAEERKFLGD